MKRLTYRKSKLPDSQAGFALVELVIALALLVLVLAGIYNYFYFGNQSAVRAHAEAEAIQDARIVMMHMEREIRQANRPRNLHNLPEEIDPADIPSSRAVVITGGTEMIIFTYVAEIPVKVSYRIVNGPSFSVMERSEDALDNTEPANWVAVIAHIVTLTGHQYFSVNDKQVEISFKVMDEKGKLNNPLEVVNTFTVRGRGAMR